MFSTYQSEDGSTKKPSISVKIGNIQETVLVDSGASLNLIASKTYERWCRSPKLSQTNTRLYPYGSRTPIPLQGEFSAVVTHGGRSTTAKFYIVNGPGCSLLSYDTSVKLGLITPVDSVLSTETSTEKIVKQFSDILAGKDKIGKLNDQKIKLSIDETIPGTVQPHRRIPFHVRKATEIELKRLTELDIIEPVTDGATPWVSPIRVVPKPKQPGEIRITVDMRAPNKAIRRERHITPTIEDIIAKLSGAKVFSKLDLNAGYHQLELDEASRYITTFSTHIGLQRYKRLNMGVTAAAEIFQNTLSDKLKDIPGVMNVSDDILVYGSTIDEHDARLRMVLSRLKEKNLTLNA